MRIEPRAFLGFAIALLAIVAFNIFIHFDMLTGKIPFPREGMREVMLLSYLPVILTCLFGLLFIKGKSALAIAAGFTVCAWMIVNVIISNIVYD